LHARRWGWVSNVALGRPVVEPVGESEAATDGIVTGYTGSKGYAHFRWPDNLTVDLGQTHDLVAIRMLLWDGLGSGKGHRAQRSYKYRLLVSADAREWKVLFDTNGDSYNGWQVFTLSEPLSAQFVRVHGLWNSANSAFHIVQVEAHDSPPPPLTAEATLECVVGVGALATEDGDGLPLERSVDSIVNSLEALVASNNVLNPEPFKELIAQLRLQVSDISTLERRMGAVRRQIVEPVEAELKVGRKYSVGGYWFGFIGGLIGLISLLLYLFSK